MVFLETVTFSFQEFTKEKNKVTWALYLFNISIACEPIQLC